MYHPSTTEPHQGKTTSENTADRPITFRGMKEISCEILTMFMGLSSVWIMALTGCSAKRSVQLPLTAQDSIHLQAKAAAADVKRDVEGLAYFGAGMSATLAAGMCGLMTGFITDVTLGQGQDDLFYLTASMSAAGTSVCSLQYYIRPPNPPLERLIGKCWSMSNFTRMPIRRGCDGIKLNQLLRVLFSVV